MAYRVVFTVGADRDFRSLSREVQIRLKPRIDALSDNPRSKSAKQLVGAGPLWRLRVGDWRIVYEIRDRELVVLIVRLGHRREVYRR